MQPIELEYYSVKSVEESVTNIEEAIKYYLRALKNYARQVYTSSSELMKSSTVAVLQSKFDQLGKIHDKLLTDHSKNNVFHLLKSSSRSPEQIQLQEESDYVCRSFQAVNRMPYQSLVSIATREFVVNQEMSFDTVKLRHSIGKDTSQFEFETHAAHLQVLENAELFDVGHIYCGAQLKPKIQLFCGKFGTIVSNSKENMVGRMDLHVEKIHHVVVKGNLQLYFLPTDKPMVWSGLCEKLKVDGLFLAENSFGTPNYSKMVHIVDDERIYFASAAHRILLLTWTEIHEAIYKAQKLIGTHEVLFVKNLSDFYVTKSILVSLTDAGLIYRCFLPKSGLVTDKSEFRLEYGAECQYQAITGDENMMVVACSQVDALESTFTLFDRKFQTLDSARVKVVLPGLNQVRQLYWLQRSPQKRFVLALWMYNIVDLFAVDSNTITIIERHDCDRSDDRIRLNGCFWNSTQTKLLVYGDFNFQRHLLMKL